MVLGQGEKLSIIIFVVIVGVLVVAVGAWMFGYLPNERETVHRPPITKIWSGRLADGRDLEIEYFETFNGKRFVKFSGIENAIKFEPSMRISSDGSWNGDDFFYFAFDSSGHIAENPLFGQKILQIQEKLKLEDKGLRVERERLGRKEIASRTPKEALMSQEQDDRINARNMMDWFKMIGLKTRKKLGSMFEQPPKQNQSIYGEQGGDASGGEPSN